MNAQELKQLTSRLYELCSRLYPEEFNSIFTAKREVFMDWLNGKTGLNVNHITDKAYAIQSWVNALEEIETWPKN